MERTDVSQRIDQWLWHARFVKSRSLAQKLVASGCVRIDRERVTSVSKKLQPGNVLTIAIAGSVRIVEVVALAKRRGPYSEACKLYIDRTPVDEATGTDEKNKPDSIERHKRPERRDRREAIKLKQDFPDY